MMPSLVAMTIAATRIYRSLSHFASPPDTYENYFFSNCIRAHCGLCHHSVNDSEPDNASWQRGLVSTYKDAAVVHIPIDRLEVSVHTNTTNEEHAMSKPADKPHELGFEDN
jgi:hypothetical protein